MIIKILIFMGILVGCSIVCYLLSWVAGRLNWMKSGKPVWIIPVIILAVLGSLPVLSYLPYLLPPIPKGEEDATSWILLGSITMNAWLIMDGVKHGQNKRSSKKTFVRMKGYMYPWM